MPLRYFSQDFYDYRGTSGGSSVWRVEIYDTEFSGTAAEMEAAEQGVVFNWQGTGELFAPVLASSASYTMLVQNAAQETFIDELVAAPEERFRLYVKRDGNVDWMGFIVTDEVRILDESYPFEFQISAVDGIARLREIDYKAPEGDPEFEGRVSLKDHLINVLNYIPAHDSIALFSGPFLRICCKVFNELHDENLSPLTQTEIDHAIFNSTDDNGNVVYVSCYDVLKNIATIFGARIFHSNGRYWFVQVPEREGDPNFLVFDFNTTGNPLGSEVVSFDFEIDKITRHKLAVGEYTFLPPIRKAVHDYTHFTDSNRAKGLTFPNDPPGYETLSGTVLVDEDGETEFQFTATFRSYSNIDADQSDPPVDEEDLEDTFDYYPGHRHRWRLYIQIGDKWIKRRNADNFSYNTPGEPEWVDVEDYIEVESDIHNRGHNQAFRWVLPVVNIPLLAAQNEGSIEIKVEKEGEYNSFYEQVSTSQTGINSVEFDWSVYSLNVEIKNEGQGDNPNDTTRRCTAISDITTNTEVINSDTIIGDGPSELSLSRLTVNGGEYNNNWSYRLSPDATLCARLVRQKLAMRKDPVRVLSGTLLASDMNFLQRIIENGRAYIPLQVSYEITNFRWAGTWAEVNFTGTEFELFDEVIAAGPTPAFVPPVSVPVPPSLETDGFIVPTLAEIVSVSETTAGIQPTEINASDAPYSLPIDPVGVAFVAAGDQINIINPENGNVQTVTVAEDYNPNSSTLLIDDPITQVFPPGSFINVNALSIATQNTTDTSNGLTCVTQKDLNFSGVEWFITAGPLPSLASDGEDFIDLHVELYASGVRRIHPVGFTINNTNNSILFSPKLREEIAFIKFCYVATESQSSSAMQGIMNGNFRMIEDDEATPLTFANNVVTNALGLPVGSITDVNPEGFTLNNFMNNPPILFTAVNNFFVGTIAGLQVLLLRTI